MARGFTFASVLALVLMADLARGAGFEAVLEVTAGKNQITAISEPARSRKPLDKRPVLNGSAGAHLTAKYKVTRSGKDAAKDVLVHFYAVRIDQLGQAPPPLDPQRVAIESALTMDFPPGDSAAATLPFQIDGPGVYLVRVEMRGNSEEPGNEDYAAIDLVVK